MSENWWRLPPYTTCSMRPEGGPLGQAAKPRPKGCGPLPLPRGQATLQFWAVGGAILSLTPKIIFEVGLAPIRGRWWVWVHPCAEKKETEKTAKQSFQPSWTEFCKAHISKLVCAPPFFLLSLRSPHQIVPKNAKKKFRIFWTPPPPKKLFLRPCHDQNHPNSGVFCIHLINDAKRPKKRAQIYSKRS